MQSSNWSNASSGPITPQQAAQLLANRVCHPHVNTALSHHGNGSALGALCIPSVRAVLSTHQLCTSLHRRVRGGKNNLSSRRDAELRKCICCLSVCTARLSGAAPPCPRPGTETASRENLRGGEPPGRRLWSEQPLVLLLRVPVLFLDHGLSLFY